MKDYSDIRIIVVPYDAGHPDLRMGAGPQHLLEGGLDEALRSEGRRTSVITVRHQSEPTAEVATAFELQRLVSARFQHAGDHHARLHRRDGSGHRRGTLLEGDGQGRARLLRGV